ncbi:MAG: TfoX/Sxy family protein [Ignavibacteriaceae bacterium]|nr:TfoX/Sxy family protein [Ignavibacteriaceae bacterium]
MAFNEHLANRTRELLLIKKNVKDNKMMGGLTFMVNNKMCVGILNDELMARIDPAVYESVLERKDCREMDFTGRNIYFLSPSKVGLVAHPVQDILPT